MEELRFPVSIKLRLDWSELDPFGHINNVMYFKYLQASRIRYWEMLGLDILHSAQGIGPLLASTRCDFRKPLYYPGEITVQASITYIKNTSFGLTHQILNNQGEIAAEGQDVIVLFDYTRLEKVPVPEKLRSQVAEMEGRNL